MKASHLLTLALVLGLGSLKLPATLMTPLPIEELARRADFILHGSVTGKTCLRSPEGRIYTRVELQVQEVWKGNLITNTFAIVHGGGTVGNRRTSVSGQVEYSVGEEVVTFLVINPRGEGVTIGLAQGKFHVWKDQTTGGKFAYNLFHGATEKEAARGENQAARLAIRDLANKAKGGAR